MIWVDYTIIGIIALSTLIGLIRGLVREALSLVAWVVALWVAFSFAPHGSGLFASHIQAPSLQLAAAFASLFIITLILAAVVNYLITRLVDKSGLKGTDHMLGVLFGTARGVVVVSLVVLLAGATPLPKDQWWQESVLINHFQPMAVWLRGYLPPEFAQKFEYASDHL